MSLKLVAWSPKFAACAIAILTALMPVRSAFAQVALADFYKGKTVTIVVGIEQGTGFDIYGRALARHIGRHLPGTPTVIVNNMPGASGLIAYNWIASVAPKDGTTFVIASFNVPFEPMLGNEQARFKGQQLSWIGNMDASGVSVCLARPDAGISKWADIYEREITMGAAGRGGAISQVPRALIEIGGAKIKLIEGYVGTASVKLAIQRNELQGICGISLSTVRSQWRDVMDSGAVRMILQVGAQPDPSLGTVPHIFEFAKTEADKQVYQLIFGPQALGRSFAAPPGTLPERLGALRNAFMATMKDAKFLEDARQANLDLAPQSGEEVQAFVELLYASPPQSIERARKALGR